MSKDMTFPGYWFEADELKSLIERIEAFVKDSDDPEEAMKDWQDCLEAMKDNLTNFR